MLYTCRGYCEKGGINPSACIVFPKTKKHTFFNVSPYRNHEPFLFAKGDKRIILLLVRDPRWNIDTRLYEFPPEAFCIVEHTGARKSVQICGKTQWAKHFKKDITKYNPKTIAKRMLAIMGE